MGVSVRRTTGSICRGGIWAVVPIWFVAISGCGAQIPAAAPVAGNKANQEPEGCRVGGRIVSTVWRDRGGRIERAIVSAWTLPQLVRVAEFSGEGAGFEVRLPPGKYRLVCSAVGTRGATFEALSREITVAERQDSILVGQVDLPISKTTELYGKPAPELGGIIAWQDTPPLTLKGLQGRIVVLDFFGYYCSICHEHKPDLVKLRDKYEGQGLVVLAVHDASLKTLVEMNEKMGPVLRRVFNGVPPKLPIALDGPGEQNVFQAYGIFAVPALILIDQQGRVVRRYHHAGNPDLEADVQALLAGLSKRVQ